MNLTTLNPVMLIVIVVAVLAIGVALWMYMSKRQTQKLRSKFGPEYDKAIGEHRDRGHAESELQKREERVAKFKIHSLEAVDFRSNSSLWLFYGKSYRRTLGKGKRAP